MTFPKASARSSARNDVVTGESAWFDDRFLRSAFCWRPCHPAAAQSWPTKPVRVIVPFTAGSAVDIVARAVMEQVSTQIGQPVIVENRGGAGGTLGVGLVAKADPDGHTMLVHSTTHAVTATTYTNPGYDARKDFAAITALANVPNVLVTAPGKYKSVKDMIEAGRAKPGSLNYASAGAGSARISTPSGC